MLQCHPHMGLLAIPMYLTKPILMGSTVGATAAARSYRGREVIGLSTGQKQIQHSQRFGNSSSGEISRWLEFYRTQNQRVAFL